MITCCDQEETSPPKEHPQKRVEKGDLRKEEGSQQPDPNPRKADDIRDNLMIEVNHGNSDKGSNKGEIEKITPRRAKFGKQAKRTQGSDPLDERILEGDRRIAVSAFSSQDEVTGQRNIIIKPDWALTLGAVGTWLDNRLLPWQTMNAHV